MINLWQCDICMTNRVCAEEFTLIEINLCSSLQYPDIFSTGVFLPFIEQNRMSDILEGEKKLSPHEVLKWEVLLIHPSDPKQYKSEPTLTAGSLCYENTRDIVNSESNLQSSKLQAIL